MNVCPICDDSLSHHYGKCGPRVYNVSRISLLAKNKQTDYQKPDILLALSADIHSVLKCVFGDLAKLMIFKSKDLNHDVAGMFLFIILIHVTKPRFGGK